MSAQAIKKVLNSALFHNIMGFEYGTWNISPIRPLRDMCDFSTWESVSNQADYCVEWKGPRLTQLYDALTSCVWTNMRHISVDIGAVVVVLFVVVHFIIVTMLCMSLTFLEYTYEWSPFWHREAWQFMMTYHPSRCIMSECKTIIVDASPCTDPSITLLSSPFKEFTSQW